MFVGHGQLFAPTKYEKCDKSDKKFLQYRRRLGNDYGTLFTYGCKDRINKGSSLYMNFLGKNMYDFQIHIFRYKMFFNYKNEFMYIDSLSKYFIAIIKIIIILLLLLLLLLLLSSLLLSQIILITN